MPRKLLAVLALARIAWQRLVQSLFTMSRHTTAVACSALFAGIALADYLTPPELNLAFAYGLVILLATWNIGAAAGVAFALLASVAQTIAMSQTAETEAQTFYWYVILGNRIFTFAIVVALTAPLRKLYDREHADARIDTLTGAVNRKHFHDLLVLEIARSRRSGAPFSVAYIDCDDFKAINDVHGHQAGDDLLRTIVRSARGALRITDVVSRLGGDEFAILFTHTEGSEALRALERIRADLRKAFGANGWRASLSIGAATFEKPALQAEQIVSICDSLMYRAKTAGKDRVVYELVGAG